MSAILAVALWRARGPGRRVLAGVLLVAGLAAAAAASPAGSSIAAPPPHGSHTRLVWSDEFGGPADAPPSRSAWVHEVGAYGWTNHELETVALWRSRSDVTVRSLAPNTDAFLARLDSRSRVS